MFKLSLAFLFFSLIGCTINSMQQPEMRWENSWPTNKKDIISAFNEAQKSVKTRSTTECVYLDLQEMPEQIYDYALNVKIENISSVEAEKLDGAQEPPKNHHNYEAYRKMLPYAGKDYYVLWFNVDEGYRVGYGIIVEGGKCLAVALDVSFDN